MAPERNAISSAAPRLRLAACAVRTFARTDTIIPMNPAAPDRIAPMANPIATGIESRIAPMMKITMPTTPIVVYWRTR